MIKRNSFFLCFCQKLLIINDTGLRYEISAKIYQQNSNEIKLTIRRFMFSITKTYKLLKLIYREIDLLIFVIFIVPSFRKHFFFFFVIFKQITYDFNIRTNLDKFKNVIFFYFFF